MAGIAVLPCFSVPALVSHRREGDRTQESGLPWLGDHQSASLFQGTCAGPRIPGSFTFMPNYSSLGFWGWCRNGLQGGPALCCPHLSAACRWQVSG